jgi:hypothetical protein
MDNLDKDNLDNQPVETNNTQGNLQAQLNSLRQLIASTLVLVFMVAGALNIYFWRQYRSIQAELGPLQMQSARITAEVNNVNGAANELARRLIEFGKTHPDFQPILKKYNLQQAPATNAPAAAVPAAAPVPAPAAKQKK